jgi:hypothetical protein
MKTVVVKTEKIIGHKNSGMPIIDVISQKISPELTFNKFIKYLPNQQYLKATVIKVLNDGKEVDEIEKYQAMIDGSLKPEVKAGEAIDYKALSEKQSAKMAEMMQRLEALEDKKEVDPIDTILKEGLKNEANKEDSKIIRMQLEDKANELNISFRANIGDTKLLEKIQAIEPEFNIN